MLVKVRRILKLGLLPVNDSLGSYKGACLAQNQAEILHWTDLFTS